MSDLDYLLPRDDTNDHGVRSPENHRPYIPKYSMKNENLLRRVDLSSIESINAVFFPNEYANGTVTVVPRHILGLDTDFSFVAKKIEEFKQLAKAEQKRELVRWDKMQRWERNLYEDRIAILMQQRALLNASQVAADRVPSTTNSNHNIAANNMAGVLVNRAAKRHREYAMAASAAMAPLAVAVGAPVDASMFALGGNTPTAAGEIVGQSPPGTLQQTMMNYSEIPESKRRCIRMKPPIPSRFQGYVPKKKS